MHHTARRIENMQQEVHKFNSKTKDDLRMLSNFHKGRLTIEARNYPSGEAAFHGEKFQTASTAPWIHPDRSKFLAEYATLFQSQESPLKARKMGGKHECELTKHEMREWDKWIADRIQRLICRAKMKDRVIFGIVMDHSKTGKFYHQDNHARSTTPWGCKIIKESLEVIGMNKLGKIWDEVAEYHESVPHANKKPRRAEVL